MNETTIVNKNYCNYLKSNKNLALTSTQNNVSFKLFVNKNSNNKRSTTIATMCNLINKKQPSQINIATLVLIYCFVYGLINSLFVTTVYSSVNQAVERPTKVLDLTSSNFEQSTNKYMIVVLNFYADWCPYSARWKPVFEKTALHIYEKTKDYPANTIIFGFINSVEETTLSQRFKVTKFPTTKTLIFGRMQKSEYRGARTLEAFSQAIMKTLEDPIDYVKDYVTLHSKVEESKQAMILYSGFKQEQSNDKKPHQSAELESFKHVARQLKDYCKFYYVLSHSGSDLLAAPNTYKLIFKHDHKPLGSLEELYSGNLIEVSNLVEWSRSMCIPLVREITFENAEELTEEGLPFVILFYDRNDKAPIDLYKKVIQAELMSEVGNVAFLYADGYLFSHPLYHLGKGKKDLPLIAIDNFRHLFLYKDSVASISQPGKLKQFIQDLHSGKLDREFHFGPDVAPQDQQIPESAFQKLAPSPHRYSFPHDEL